MTLQSVFALGIILGVLISPLIADLKGKRIAIGWCLISMFVGYLCIFFGILNKLYFIIGLGQILSAFGSVPAATISYSVSSDFFSDDLRQKSVMFYCAAW
jgi:MFS family permease